MAKYSSVQSPFKQSKKAEDVVDLHCHHVDVMGLESVQNKLPPRLPM